MTVNAIVSCRDVRNTPHAAPCVLALCDNTSVIGWLYRSSRLTKPLHHIHLQVAWHLAHEIINHNCCLYSQHIPEHCCPSFIIWWWWTWPAPPHCSRPARRCTTHPPIPRFTHLFQTDNVKLQHIPTTARHRLMAEAHLANTGILCFGRTEQTFESSDRAWRRWCGYCRTIGITDAPQCSTAHWKNFHPTPPLRLLGPSRQPNHLSCEATSTLTPGRTPSGVLPPRW